MFNKLLFFVYVLYCFEVGLFLLIFPWMQLWQENALLTYLPDALRAIVLSNYFRGAVSGLGIANILLGIWEVLDAFFLPKGPVDASDPVRHFES